MKRFETTDSEGNRIIGGVPFYPEDLDFIQDATREVFEALIDSLRDPFYMSKPLNVQLGKVVKYEKDPQAYIVYGGYFFLNGKLYYCAPLMDSHNQKKYLVLTDDELDEGARSTISDSVTVKPWKIRRVVLQEEPTDYNVDNIPTLREYLFNKLEEDTKLLIPSVRSWGIINRPEKWTLSLSTSDSILYNRYKINYTNGNSEQAFENTLTLPDLDGYKKVILAYNGTGTSINQTVIANGSTLFSYTKSGSLENPVSMKTTLIFENVESGNRKHEWILISRIDE